MDVPQLVNHLPIEGQLGCFQFLGIVNNKYTMNIHVQIFMQTGVFKKVEVVVFFLMEIWIRNSKF